MRRQTNVIAKKTTLNAVEQYELNQWLEQHHINSANLRRSFTDVLPLARLLTRYYPDLIDLNYYPPRNSVHNKLCNWESFNKRVLTRLGLNLSREQMVRVARSVPGSVDLLLHSIMKVQMDAERRAREAKGSSEEDDDVEEANQVDQSKDNAKANVADILNDNDNDDDEDSQNLQSDKSNMMPRTLKQAQAALKRSERSHMMMGHGQHRGVATAIMQRAAARSSTSGNSNRQQIVTAENGASGTSAVKRGRQTVAAKKRQDRPF